MDPGAAAAAISLEEAAPPNSTKDKDEENRSLEAILRRGAKEAVGLSVESWKKSAGMLPFPLALYQTHPGAENRRLDNVRLADLQARSGEEPLAEAERCISEEMSTMPAIGHSMTVDDADGKRLLAYFAVDKALLIRLRDEAKEKGVTATPEDLFKAVLMYRGQYHGMPVGVVVAIPTCITDVWCSPKRFRTGWRSSKSL